MDDQLKKYVQENRDDFDHLEPSESVYLRIREGLQTLPKKEKNVFRLFAGHKWMAAASVMLMLSLTYLVLNQRNRHAIVAPRAMGAAPKVPQTAMADTGKSVAGTQTDHIARATYSRSGPSVLKKGKRDQAGVNISAIYNDLADSSSASTRLTAVLKIRESEVMNAEIVDNLAKTLNHDPNSNVRLAVLDLAGKYANNSYVAGVFLQSLTSQQDPLVQLGLIDLLSRVNDRRLDERLYALAGNPETTDAVRDRAYLVLLNQNKL
ncbi:HEAT repeat domain-containing protein [Hufsiella ginkgonis]|uniref:HEAT repeat domain-containing protein n=1 Tax=Hufsiella ginkgonis TaxID=2695274 RepID=A0A7K1Y279_9SPHI|nr:HEAT repeat domain-containing protein [Hufsiella ginkgonis]MXV17119.1 hypothetical protein [Hufsiella ginkgonis]